MKVFILFLAACFALAFIPVPAIKPAGATVTTSRFSDLPLVNTHWRLIELDGKKIPANATSKEMYLLLKSDSTVTGNGGCNTFSGHYSLGKSEAIMFGEMVRTNILCPSIDFERKYMNAIATCDHYKIIGNELSLQNKFVSLAKFEGSK